MKSIRMPHAFLTAIVLAASTTSAALAAEPSFDVYGFGQVDYIQDFNRTDPAWDATLRASKIPTADGEFGSDGQSILTARQSRLGVEAKMPTGNQELHTKFEFDLFGVGVDEGQTTIRLRHAFGQYGPILGGQTNSVFMDADIFPNVIDYWGPAGMVFFRTAQLRWTQGGDHTTYAIAVEHATDDIDPGQIRELDEDLANSVQGDEKAPDLTAHVQQKGDWGHVQLAGILRRIGFETIGSSSNKPKGHETGWGVDLTSVINVREKDALKLGVVAGAGIASYMNDGGMDLAPDGSTTTAITAKAVPLLGVSAYYDVQWSEKWTSSLGYSFTQVDNTNFQSGSAFHMGQYASANIIYHPIEAAFWGLEYLWGRREDNNGDDGVDNRVQVSAHYKFSSKDYVSTRAKD